MIQFIEFFYEVLIDLYIEYIGDSVYRIFDQNVNKHINRTCS